MSWRKVEKNNSFEFLAVIWGVRGELVAWKAIGEHTNFFRDKRALEQVRDNWGGGGERGIFIIYRKQPKLY
jgi:hypothetical protein